ncbi:acyltransferase domain-containing protein [Streptomyces naphthomycinicus]|uniref:acyltransferase domain-containing protein n=1 Tax=Streptomyces naphthomycinicus TaxID=2872625 RepID=UPI001CEC74C6|nr:acyltransferase domain-containing protein [Streptomyces sp. TML10]
MRSIAFLLPGQGSQSAGMATRLYAHDEVFAAAMDEFFAALGDSGRHLRADWLSADPVLPMDHVQRSQPLLFAVDHAYGRLLRSWGITPAALLGHSMGEVAAAVLAGVLDFTETARLVWWRCARLVDAPPGGMLAVAASPDTVRPLLRGQVVVGGVNAPKQTIVAGPRKALDEVAGALRAQGITCAAVPSQTPFHSPALNDSVPAAREAFTRITRRPPAVPVVSCYTAAPLTDAEAMDPDYWAPQPARPVLFWPALETLLASGDHVLVETGPGQVLSRLARRHPAVRAGRSSVVPLAPVRPGDEVATLRAAREALAAAEASTVGG